MAITIVASSVATLSGASTTNRTVTLPGTPLQDDIIIICAVKDTVLANPTPVTAGYAYIVDAETATVPAYASFWKRMGSTPDTTVTLGDLISAGITRLALYLVRGVDTTTAIDNSFNSANSTTGMPNPASHTTVTNGALRIVQGFLDDDAVASITAPSGYGDLQFQGTASGNDESSIMMASLVDASASSEDPAAFGGTGTDEWVALHFALRPASPAIGVPISKGIDASGTTSGAVAATTLASGAGLLAYCCSLKTSAAVTGKATVSDTQGLTWTEVADQAYDPGSGNRLRLTVYFAVANGSNTTVSMLTNDSTSRAVLEVILIPGAGIPGANKAFGTNAAGDPSATITTPAAGSAALAFGFFSGAFGIDTEPAGYTYLNQGEQASAPAVTVMSHYDLSSPATTAAYVSTNANSVTLLMEIPTVAVGVSVTATAGAGALEAEGFAAVAAATAHKSALATAGAIEAEGWVPVAAATDHKAALTTAGALEVEGFVPAASVSDHKAALATGGALEAEGFAAVAAATAHKSATATAGAIEAEGWAAVAAATAHVAALTTAGAMEAAGEIPMVQALQGVNAIPAAGAVRVAGNVPVASATAHVAALASAGAVEVEGFVPVAVAIGTAAALATAGALEVEGRVPVAAATAHVQAAAASGAVRVAGQAPVAATTAHVAALAADGAAEVAGFVPVAQALAGQGAIATAGAVKVAGNVPVASRTAHVSATAAAGEIEAAGAVPFAFAADVKVALAAAGALEVSGFVASAAASDHKAAAATAGALEAEGAQPVAAVTRHAFAFADAGAAHLRGFEPEVLTGFEAEAFAQAGGVWLTGSLCVALIAPRRPTAIRGAVGYARPPSRQDYRRPGDATSRRPAALQMVRQV